MTERQLFERRFRKHKRMVASVAMRYTSCRSHSEDIIQKTFIAAWLHRNTFQRRSGFATWLYRITVNVAIQHLVREKLHSFAFHYLQSSSSVHSDYTSPVNLLADREHLERIEKCLMNMPFNLRVAFMLATFDGESYAYIAQSLNAPIGTIRSRIHRARSMLREEFADIL